MAKKYSRLRRTQKKKNIRNTLVYFVLSVSLVAFLIFIGIPLLIKYTSFVSDIRKSSEPIQKSDTTPPPPPRINPIPSTTNNLELEVSGRTEPGATVKIFYNSKEESLLANSEGSFTSTIKLIEGENKIYFRAIDSSGNESRKTQSFTVSYDNEPPKLTISSPEDGKTFYGSSQRQLTIKGVSESGTRVTINERVVIVDDEGNFTYVITLSEGENTFTIISKDEAGNQTEESLNINYSP